MSEQEREYLRTVASLQELARNAPYVTQDWVLQVASMDQADMRRRLIRSSDWHGHFAHSLDGIEAIKAMPGSGIDGCRSHKEVRAVVEGLLEKIKRLEASRAALASAPATPAGEASGWKLVPVEPTIAMLCDAVKTREGPAVYKVMSAGGLATLEAEAADEYRAMLAAAPAATPPSPSAEAEDLARRIHAVVKRGRDTQDHGLVGNLRCVLDHLTPDPEPFDAQPTDAQILAMLDGLMVTGENQNHGGVYRYRSLGAPCNVTGPDLVEFARRVLERFGHGKPAVQTTVTPSAPVGDGVALGQIVEALEHSRPTHAHYPETVNRHAQALATARALATQQAGEEAAYRLGWRRAAEWANRDDLAADVDSQAFSDCMRVDLKLAAAHAAQAQAACTCPSGDGSLRWPCPVHLATSAPVGDGAATEQAEAQGVEAALAMLERIDTRGEDDDARVDAIAATIRRLAKDVHDLNWALGTPGYEQMHDPADQADHEAAVRGSELFLQRMAAAKERHDAMEADAAKYRWLQDRYFGVDFDWSTGGEHVLLFKMPKGIHVSSDCDETIRAAMSAQAGDGKP